jgi:hypothetical protein
LAEELFRVAPYSPFAYYKRVRVQLEAHVPELAQLRARTEKFLLQNKTWRLSSQVPVLPKDEKKLLDKINKFYMDTVPIGKWLNQGEWLQSQPAVEFLKKSGQLNEYPPTESLSVLDILGATSFFRHFTDTQKEKKNEPSGMQLMSLIAAGGGSRAPAAASAAEKDPYEGLRFDDTWTVPMLNGEKVFPSPTPRVLAAAIEGILFLRPTYCPLLFNAVFYDIYGHYSRLTHKELIRAIKHNKDKVTIWMYQEVDILYASTDVRGLAKLLYARFENAKDISSITEGENY